MDSINILDVTLRDGGYQTKFHFDNTQLSYLLNSAEQAKFEYIEVGYRNGSLRPIQNIGSTGLCPNDYLERCRQHLSQCKMAVMVHPHNITISDIKALASCGVKLVRVCVAKNTIEKSVPIIKKCVELGLEISVNLTRMSHYSAEEIDKTVTTVSKLPVDMVYFADSNGSMLPNQISAIYTRCAELTEVKLGFHAHDNLGLAQANSIAAINAGAKYIDVSMAGLGKDIGNLNAELFVAYLHALKNEKYDLDIVREASSYIRQLRQQSGTSIKEKNFSMGIADISINELSV